MLEKTELQFRKYSGIGNTFVIFRNQNVVDAILAATKKDFSDIIRLCCDPVFGAGADGGFLLSEKSENVWEWLFFNSDGSPAEMCGNAARCAAHSIFESHSGKGTEIYLSTKAGKIRCEMKAPGIYAIEMIDPHWVAESIVVDGLSMCWVDSGVPHAVFQGEPMSIEKSRHFRQHPTFAPRGANITSFSVLKKNHLKAVSYERGVENFTLACGTGAVAAALTYWNSEYQKKTAEKIIVQMPGGELEILLAPNQKPIMSGPAVLVGEMKLSWENINKFFAI